MAPQSGWSRRDFVKDAGGLLIGFSLADSPVLPRLLAAQSLEAVAVSTPDRLDAWLRIGKDGRVRVFTGKAEIGMGLETAYAQIVAEELDISPDRVTLVMGDTFITPDQGGVGGSTSIAQGSKPLRNAAATAQALLLQLASRRLGAAPGELQARGGIVSVRSDASKSVSYGELVEATDLNNALKVSGQGAALNVEGAGQPKDPASYTIVGTSVPRKDLPPKILGQFQYVTDVRVPGMLHGRVVRPSGVGAQLVSVNEDSVRGIPGYVKTVVKGNFVGVVAESEWAAIQAAKALRVTWSAPVAAFPEQRDLYQYMHSASPKSTRETLRQGDVTAALAAAAKKLEASYEYPFHSHATMGPGCAVADVRRDGLTTVWCGAQKPHALQKGLAELLGIPADRIRVIWVADAGSYGRAGFEDAAADAALLSEAAGRPVRVQWTRADMTAWGPKGPAVVTALVAALDGQGQVSAMQFTSRALSGTEISPVPSTAGNFLAAQLTGRSNASPGTEYAQWGLQTMSYVFPNIHAVAHVLHPFHDLASAMRTTHLRDPGGPATTFAMESFIDEIAATIAVDPVEFRLKHLEDPRAKAVLSAAAEKAGWDHRASPKANAGPGDIASGRGIALGLRNGTYVCTVAEVEVYRGTGAVRVTRFVTAHDCGLVINPDGLRGTIAANLVQSLGRSMKEEVTFDRNAVTSVDWRTYSVTRSSDVPPRVEIVLLNRPEVPPTGAGEVTSRPTAAAIANAIFDATGARMRQAPMTPAKVKAALGVHV